MTTKTMFGKTKHEYLGDMISLRNPSAAQGSIRELQREFKSAKTKTKKLRIARATMLAANRASASSKRSNLSGKERGEFKEIASIYSTAANRMFASMKLGRSL